MARKVFYSFHYDNDIMRVMTVRNRWVTQGGQLASEVIDKADFEKLKRTGDLAVKRWIDSQLEGTTVTIVLVGRETLKRPFVQYEICKSIERGNAIIGVHISGIRDARTSRVDIKGNMHEIVGRDKYGYPIYFDNICEGIYDYSTQDGYNNLGSWVENAYQKKNNRTSW